MKYLAVLFIFVFIPFSAFAFIPIPFGGTVTTIQPCNTGLLVYIKSGFTVRPYMWFWGNLKYLSYVPPHPGQSVLGNASITPAPCVLGYVPYGYGLPILFHGSSL